MNASSVVRGNSLSKDGSVRTDQHIHVGELTLGPLELEIVAKGDQEIVRTVSL
jgi:hypothetical protein